MSLRQPAEALEALQKQIEANPYDEYAYFYMARAYVAQRKYAEAEAVLNKAARDQSARQVRARRPRRAVHGTAAVRESGAGVRESGRGESRRRPGTHVQLGKAYLNLRRNREATARLRSRGRVVADAVDVERRGLPAVARRRRPRARSAIRRVGDLVGRRGLAQPRRRARGRAGARHRRLARGLLGHARLGLLREGGSRAGPRPTSPGRGPSASMPRSAIISARSTRSSAGKRPAIGAYAAALSADGPARTGPRTPGAAWPVAPRRSTRSSRTTGRIW